MLPNIASILTNLCPRLILQDVLSKKPGLASVFNEFLAPGTEENFIGHIMWDTNYKLFINKNRK